MGNCKPLAISRPQVFGSGQLQPSGDRTHGCGHSLPQESLSGGGFSLRQLPRPADRVVLSEGTDDGQAVFGVCLEGRQAGQTAPPAGDGRWGGLEGVLDGYES